MGWVLIQNGTQRRLRLRPGIAQVGRAQTVQIKSTHQSVSRVHAEIKVEPATGPVSDPSAQTPISVIDRSSTGHTFVNGRPSAGKGHAVALEEGDVLAFGVDPGTYRLAWSPVVLSYSSRVPKEEVLAMEVTARSAGVFLTSEWTADCTHLVIEHLAITPKLLCCIADGGLPVATSFLGALAACPSGEAGPDPAGHRPQPPAGPDAAYTRELGAYSATPRSRHGLLDRVWAVFGNQQGHDALSLALRQAGLGPYTVCYSAADAARSASELRQHLACHGPPRAIWLVPCLDEAATAALAPTLRDIGAPVLSVSHKAVVSGILSGSLDVAHAEATRLPLGGSPAAVAAAPGPAAEVKEQDTQDKGPIGPLSIPASAPKPEEEAPRRGFSGGVTDVPMTLSSETGSGLKAEKEEEKKPGTFFNPGVPLTLGETPLGSQAKLEERKPSWIGVDSSAIKEERVEQKPPLLQRGASRGDAAAAAAGAAPSEPDPQRVVHPTCTWLSTLGAAGASRGPETCIVDGAEVPRASWRPATSASPVAAGAASRRGAQAASAAAAAAGGGAAGGGRAARRNFKLFRKADGQRGLGRSPIVPVSPWAPAKGPALAEVFCSQPLGDSDSQLLPQLPPGI